ncbi:MAG TPA: hypothetical protein VFN10_17365 [Thermoanaerobaculia bacterium]|nr:hypothetical protein [Thermoanaerobaculia bacterium]
MKRIIFTAALFLVTALPLFAQTRVRSHDFASDLQTIPVLANTNGVGNAKFQSYVALMNPTASPFAVDVTFYDNSGAPHTASIMLSAHELKTYANFLEEVFHVTGGGAATFRSASPANRFIVSSEVRTGGDGGYTTPIPTLEFAGSNSRSFAPGISVDATWRTNAGCFNQSDVANHITAKVLDKTGALTLGTVTLDLPPNGWAQTAVPIAVTDGAMQFDPSENAVCYAVVVNNATNDARVVEAVEYQP